MSSTMARQIVQANLSGRILHETRIKLIHLVKDRNLSIKRACKDLNINYSTGKLILKKYEKQGTITKFSYERTSVKQNKQKTEISPNSKEFSNQFEGQIKFKNSIFNANNYPTIFPFVSFSSFPFLNFFWNLNQDPNEISLSNYQNFRNGFCWNY